MDHSHTYLIVGLGLLGGKYAQVLSGKGYRVTGIDKDPAAVAWALEKEYICAGADHDFKPIESLLNRTVHSLCAFPRQYHRVQHARFLSKII